MHFAQQFQRGSMIGHRCCKNLRDASKSLKSRTSSARVSRAHMSKAAGVAATSRVHKAPNAVEAETSEWCTPCLAHTFRVIFLHVS
mmetsp:Transcript_9616/g.16656  ORF Transcript_9616/g.16656 Transcript_9616/m.16656 type:complete len:86 (+) Transcript_9616:65-322(+)